MQLWVVFTEDHRSLLFTHFARFLGGIAGVFRAFRVGDFRAFRLADFEALADVAGALNTTCLAVFLIPCFAMGIFLTTALADFVEASEFGAAMVWTSYLFAGQGETVKISN